MNIKNLGLSLFFTVLILNSAVLRAEEQHAHDDHADTQKQYTHNDSAHDDTHNEGDNKDQHDDEDAHEEKGAEKEGDHDGEEGGIQLNKDQQKMAGIIVEALTLKALPIEIEAHGEIRQNAYATSQITPRIDAQVVKRMVHLGDVVSRGQALVVLSSVAMAEAQGNLLVSSNEWQRVKKLGKKVVSQSRYLESRIAFQQAQAKVLTYGMTKKETKKLLKSNTISQANGNFTLYAPQAGSLIHDDFISGQLIQPGEVLFKITDESTLWIEARINPKFIRDIQLKAPARVKIGASWLNGTVIQIHHSLDELTRTLAVRIEIANKEDNFHPGQFVTVRIKAGQADKKVLSLPTNAVMRSADGDWQVFIEEEANKFEAREVDVVREIPGLMVIEGLAPGTRVVTQGAFFVQSEQAKSGFSVHNH